MEEQESRQDNLEEGKNHGKNIELRQDNKAKEEYQGKNGDSHQNLLHEEY